MTIECESLAASPAELVAGVMAGEKKAEEALVERYSRPLRAVLRQRLRQSADVDDFLQETLSLAVAKLRAGELREPDKVGSFLMAMARNLVIEHYRRRSRRQTEADSERIEREPATTREPDGEARLMVDERAQLIRRMLDELDTPRDRDILRRFYLEEEEKDSICHDLQLSALHFNRVLHRARLRYKAIIEARMGSSWRGDGHAMVG